MQPRTDIFDLGGLRMSTGEGRRFELAVALGGFEFSGEQYRTEPDLVEVRLDLSRTTANGYALRLRFEVAVSGPCMRCLADAAPGFTIDAREVSQPGGGEDLESPYVSDEAPVTLALRDWARDALALEIPPLLLCRADCLGLCTICGVNLNDAGPDHGHEPPPDPRWAKLSELRLDG